MTGSVAPALRALLQRFRSQRPLRGGSLLITIFGDAIAPRGGAVTLGALIRLARPFGLTERHVRTSVGRLAAEGWLAARRAGRRSEYRLTAEGNERFAEATRRIYAAQPAAWDGRWTLLVLSGISAPERRDIERALHWEGFGQVAPGVFARPGFDAGAARAILRDVPGADGALLLSADSGATDGDRRLVRAGWDLRELGARYGRFLRHFEPVRRALQGRAAEPQAAFVVRTLLVHEYRRIHLQDPLLPRALLPAHWIGERAYALCRRLYGQVYAAAEDYIAQEGDTLTGPLPPPAASSRERFGGIAGTGE